MTVYFDNSATTPVFPDVTEEMRDLLANDYGNPSSMHTMGVRAENRVKRAREQIAKELHCAAKEITFTSCGTEANNMAIIGGADAHSRQGKHLITTAIEHPSVLEAMDHLEKLGYEVTYLPVDGEGRISLSELQAAVRPDTILISTMMVNNEIGAREPVEEIGRWLKSERPDILYHVDCVQAFGKYRIRPDRMGIDLMSASGHKIHGPKGIGFLYKRDGVRINPIIFGGGQEKGLRSGTENTSGIVGLGLAAELIYKHLDDDTVRMYELKQRLTDAIAALPGTVINGPAVFEGAPHVVSASFEGVRSEVLLHALEERGIYVSAGSACASNHPGISGTLSAIGVRSDLLESTLRFSLSIMNSAEEVDYTASVLAELLPVLRRFTRR